MPFDHFLPKLLTTGGVHTHAPTGSGVYGLSNAREWIFIGEADNIQSALLAHLQESETLLMKRHPTGFVFELCDQAQRTVRQDRLILEYGPICNRPAPELLATVKQP